MKTIVERHWISFLGVGFVFLSFIYFLKLAIDLGWMPPEARVATGLIIGVSGLFVAYTLYLKKLKLIAETVGGFGTGILYATIAYASFSEHIQWSTNVIAITTICLSTAVSIIGYKLNMRVLVLISLLGGLLTPLIIKASPEQDFILFLYIFILNVSALYLSAVKRWREIRVVTFISTVLIYITYYFYFDPEHWGKPFFYASALYFVYLLGLILSSWKEENKFDGVNLYIGIINAINYVFWSIFIFSSFEIPYVIPILIVGASFILASTIIYKLNNIALLASGTYLILGMIVIAIGFGDLALLLETKGLHYAVNAATWLIMISAIYFLGNSFKIESLRIVGLAGWILISIFWYTVAWDVEWVEWFGVKYVPFINPGALVWIALAVVGFIFSHQLSKGSEDIDKEKNSMVFAIGSLIVLGGLFTVQIQNFWNAYDITRIDISLTLSFSWFMYALIIFLWGAFTRNIIYKWVGSVVIGLSSLKVILWDLNDESSVYKIIALLAIGLTAILIGYINNIWDIKEEIDGQ